MFFYEIIGVAANVGIVFFTIEISTIHDVM